MKKALIKIERELWWKAISLTDELYVSRLYGKGIIIEGFIELRLFCVEFKIDLVVMFREMFYGK